MTTTIVILLVILIVSTFLFGGSKKKRYNRGYYKGYNRHRYDDIRQQSEQERAIRYMKRQQKNAERYAKRHGTGLNLHQQKYSFTKSRAKKFK